MNPYGRNEMSKMSSNHMKVTPALNGLDTSDGVSSLAQTLNQRMFCLMMFIGIFLLALAIRLLYLYDISGTPAFLPITIDANGYHKVAKEFSETGNMPIRFFYQPIFYPLFLSYIYKVSGASILAAKVIQAIIGAFACSFGALLGVKLFNRATGVIAGLMLSLYGPIIFFQMQLVGESLAIFWALLLIFLFLKLEEKTTWFRGLMLGLCCGLSVVTRPTFALFILFAGIWLIVRWVQKKEAIRPLVVCLVLSIVGLLSILLPIGFLTLEQTGSFTFLPGNGGLALYLGNNPESDKTLTARPGPDYKYVTDLPQREGLEEFKAQGITKITPKHQEAYFYQKVKDYMNNDPVGYFKGLASKGVQFVCPREIPNSEDIYLFHEWSFLLKVLTWKIGGFGFPFGIAFLFALIGMIYYWRTLLGPLLIMILFYSLSIILVNVCGRYRIPMVGPMLIFSAAGVVAFSVMLKHKQWLRLLATVVLPVVVVILLSFSGPYALEKINHKSELMNYIANYQQTQGETEAAFLNFKKSVELNPDYAKGHQDLAVAYYLKNQVAESMKHLKKAVEITPYFTTARMNLAAMYEMNQQINEAEAQYRQVLKHEPYHTQAKEKLKKILQYKKDNFLQ